MAQTKQPSVKQATIDTLNKKMISTIAVAVFVAIFALVSTKTLLGQYGYQNRVISAKHVAVNQLKIDATTVKQLVGSYKAFVGTPQNVLGGNPAGSGQNDGDNAKIILDALPSKYDFPGLVSSLENMLSNQGYTINSITGTDQSLTQQSNQASATPSLVQMPFQIGVTGPYSSIQQLVNTMQLSIRPFIIQTIDISGNDSSLTATISAYTYYQPEKDFSIQSEVVK